PLVRPLQSQQAFRGRDADPWDKGKEARRRILALQGGEKSNVRSAYGFAVGKRLPGQEIAYAGDRF
ncbi:hypothetical protein, partial [Salinibacter ruber]|uniref:hypothetical protein n=2 Tax=Salinibacter ruber TaxID=146919 RepID=UPI00216A44AA